MTWTVVAQLISRDGTNVKSYFSNDPAHMWNPIRHKAWVVAPVEVRHVQGTEIPLRINHGTPPIGRITHLERRPDDGSIWCVADCDEDIAPERDTDYYLSVEAVYDEGTGADVEIRGAAICAKSCMIGLKPATLIGPNGLDHNGRATWRLGEFQRHLLEQATANRRRRRYGDPIVVHGAPAHAGLDLEASQAGPIEIRSNATTLGVSYTNRVVELCVIPYESPAVVVHHGRVVEEVVSRGSFDTIPRDGGRVKVNRDHVRERPVGRAIRFHPERHEGLVAELRISRTELGDETLALADDGVLDASAGFGVLPGGERWETKDRRRLSRLHLDHVALTADPAYEDARVLAVRGRRTNSSPTPNLDQVRALVSR